MVMPLGDLSRTRIVPIGTYGLIALNILAFLIQLRRDDSFTTSHAMTPYEITHGIDLARPEPVGLEGRGGGGAEDIRSRREVPHAAVPFPVWLTLLSAMFLHGNPLHLAGNMLYLWIFGDNVEEVLGTARYVLFYLACGVAGSLAQIAADVDSRVPSLGASGAIAGVMGAYLVWFPHNRVRVLVLRYIVETPAVVVILFWIALQVVLGFNTFGHVSKAGGVAYLAHIGGASAGIAVACLLRRRATRLKAMEIEGFGGGKSH